MSEEHDSWIQNAFGLDIGGAVQNVEDAGAAAVSQVATAVTEAVESAPVAEAAPAPVSETAAAPAPPPSAGVLDSLGSMASSAGGSLLGGAKKALDVANDAGNAISGAESATWDATKGAYGAVTGAYDSVAPNFTQDNKDLGGLVDQGEALAKKGNDAAAAQYGDVPILGSVLKATSWLGDETVEATGGVIKGAGDLAAMGGNAIFHPIDAAESLGEGALGIAEHVPTVPGLNTTVKGIHGLVDLARGKTDGEYGGTLSDLGENLLLDTKEDPNNPGKKTNADVDFFAGIGGGTQAWTDKPVEAATRTITNLVPMFLGDEGAGGKPPPEGGPPIPEAPPPSAVDPLGKTQVDPMGKTQVDPMGKTQVDPMGKTQVDPMGKTQPQIDPQGPKTEVDPPDPGEPEAPKPDGPKTPKEAAQNVADASAAQKITQQASLDTAGEFVRYRAKMPVPERGFAGDPNWDPVVDEALFEESNRASQANIEAIHKLQAAQEAALNTPGFAKGHPPRR